MRELTLLETSYLAELVLLSFILPLMMSFYGPREATARRACMKTVWIGQALGAIAGLGILASALIAPYAALFGLIACASSALALLWQVRNVYSI